MKTNNDHVSRWTTSLRTIKPIAFTILVILAIIGLGNFADSIEKITSFTSRFFLRLSPEYLSDEQLCNQASDLAKDMVQWIQERRIGESYDNFSEPWEIRTKKILDYSSQTNTTYLHRYYGKVSMLRSEFAKRDLSDPSLNRSYQIPTNYFGYGEVAMGLLSMSEELKVRSK